MVNVYDGDGDDKGSVIWNHLYKKYYWKSTKSQLFSLSINIYINIYVFIRSEIIGGLQDLPGNIKAVLAQDDKVSLSLIDQESNNILNPSDRPKIIIDFSLCVYNGTQPMKRWCGGGYFSWQSDRHSDKLILE